VGRPLKLLFCGKEFSDGARYTMEALAAESFADVKINVVTCTRDEVPLHIADADVAVPLMTRLDAHIIAQSTRLRLVLQFGVGLEGVDQAACTAKGIVLARIPSEKTGNAASTAEMAVYLLLAAMRRHNAMGAAVQSRALGTPLGRQIKVGWCTQ